MSKKRMFHRIALSMWVVGSLAGGPLQEASAVAPKPPAAAAEGTSPAEEKASNEARADAASVEHAALASKLEGLIAELGSGSFQAREAATAELLAIGSPALPALNRSRPDEDPEVRQRINMISQRLAQDDLEARVEAFLSGKEDASLPGWEYARVKLGDRLVLREIFVEISRKHPKLAASLDGTPRDRTIALQEASTRVNLSLITISNLPSVADAIGLLLAALAPDTPPTEATDATLLRLLARGDITVSLQDAEVTVPLRRLLGEWIQRVTKSKRSEALFFAMQWNIEEGLLLAATTIRETEDVETLEFALQTVARFGSPSDALMLKPLLDDTRPAGYASVDRSGRPLRTQVSDAAMAAIGIVNGRKLRDLGFPAAETHSKVGFNVDTLGFPIGPEGDAARARVREEIDGIVKSHERVEDIVPRVVPKR